MIERMLRVGVIAGVFGLVLPGIAAAQRPVVESDRLEELLEARGFQPPEGFKALVVRLEPRDRGGFTPRYHDWRGTSDDRTDWWPASSIKIYAAVAAIERMAELGFPMRTFLTYHYEKDGEPDEVTARFDQIVHRAIAQSSNPDFDMLVELVGFDEINRDFFVRDNGFRDTVFLRGYSNRDRDPVTSINSARPSPRITLRHGRRERVLPARTGTGNFDCPDEGNCTTLQDLAEVMRRIMLHESLPERERYRISDDAMEVLRGAMAIARNRRLADVFVESFGEVPVEVWHKPGFAMRWISDTLFIHRTDTGERWIVAMAGRFGRRSLDDAAAHIAALLLSRALCDDEPRAGGSHDATRAATRPASR